MSSTGYMCLPASCSSWKKVQILMQEKDSRAQTVGDKPYRLLERSIFCDRMVFVEALHDAKYLTDMELSIYESWYGCITLPEMWNWH